jgi:hypothetical protein
MGNVCGFSHIRNGKITVQKDGVNLVMIFQKMVAKKLRVEFLSGMSIDFACIEIICYSVGCQ